MGHRLRTGWTDRTGATGFSAWDDAVRREPVAFCRTALSDDRWTGSSMALSLYNYPRNNQGSEDPPRSAYFYAIQPGRFGRKFDLNRPPRRRYRPGRSNILRKKPAPRLVRD